MRIKAAELAAQVLQGQMREQEGARLFAYVVFFENYILNGTDHTEKTMRLLARRKVRHLKVLAGGRL